MKKEKKPYQSPKVQKVKLVLRDAVLGTCHSSPVMTPAGVNGCAVELNCWDGTGILR